MKKFFSLLSLIMLISLSAIAQSSVKGIVKDETEQGLPFANVVLYTTEDNIMVKGDITQDDGSFVLPGVGAGNYYLVISYVGMNDQKVPGLILSGDSDLDLGNVKMASQSNELTEVTVTAKRPLLELKTDKVVFNVDGSINATGSDAMELLRKSPGVLVDNNDNISIMGKSGVVVYIDGKQSPLRGSELATFLRNLSSEQIDAIEIISNPSSKYDAQGNAGVINIRLKKDKNLGANGSLSLNGAQGHAHRYSGTLSGNYRSKELNLYGSYTHSTGDNWNKFNLYREQSALKFDQNAFNGGDWGYNGFKAGADFYANDKSTFGVLVNGNISDGNFNSDSRTRIAGLSDDNTQAFLLASNRGNWGNHNLNYNANYKFDNKKGTSLNIDLDYGTWDNPQQELQPNEYMDQNGESITSRSTFFTDSPKDIDIYTGKLDYETPAFGGVLAAGLKSTMVKTNNVFDFYDVVLNENILNTNRSNTFNYDERVQAAYVNFNKQLSKFNISFGLRVEHTNSDGLLLAQQNNGTDRVKMSYTDLFPSGGVSWSINDKHSLQANYSRRLNRPNYQDLNPFRSQLDELTFEQGNPFLNPEYTDNFQLVHSWNYKLTTTLSFSHTKDQITRITDIEGERSAYITWLNLDDQYNYSINLGAPISVTSWWSTYTSVTGYITENKADYGENKTVDLSARAMNVYQQHSFSLPGDFTAELSGWYNSPAIWGGTFEMDAMANVDFGIQKRVLNGQGNIKVSVSDIFNTNNWRGIAEFGNLYMIADGQWDSRRAKVAFTYNFGNQAVKSRKRKTGIEDESSRVKSSN